LDDYVIFSAAKFFSSSRQLDQHFNTMFDVYFRYSVWIFIHQQNITLKIQLVF